MACKIRAVKCFIVQAFWRKLKYKKSYISDSRQRFEDYTCDQKL